MLSWKTLLPFAALALCLCASPRLHGQDLPIAPEQFGKLHQLIKPQPSELRFHEIAWLLSVHDARVLAAKQGKPILVWSGAGGAPLGVC